MIKNIIILFLIFNLFLITNQHQIKNNIYNNDLNNNNDNYNKYNNNIINIYFNKDGSDVNNGTIHYPYYSVCKLSEVLSSSNRSDIIIINFGNNGAFYGGCLVNISGFSNITFQNYTTPNDGSGSGEDFIYNPYIFDVSFYIDSSNFTISNVNIYYQSSILVKFECINSSFQYYSSTFQFVINFKLVFNNSVILFSDLEFLQDFQRQIPVKINNSTLQLESCILSSQLLDITNSNVISNNSHFNRGSLNFVLSPSESTYSSSSSTSEFELSSSINNYKFYFNNTYFNTMVFNFIKFQSILFQNCQFQYYNQFYTDVFQLNGTQLILERCRFLIPKNDVNDPFYFRSFFSGISSGLQVLDSEFHGFRFVTGFLSMETSNILFNNVTFDLVQSKAYFYLYRCEIKLNEIQFLGFYQDSASLRGDTIIDIKEISNVTISNCKFVYYGYIIINNLSGDKKSNITIQDSRFNDTQGFEFKKSNIQFRNVHVTTFRNLQSVFKISTSSEFNGYNCIFSSSNLLGSSFLFNVEYLTVINLIDCIVTESSSVLSLRTLSSANFKDSSFVDLYSTNTDMFNIQDYSNLTLDGCIVSNVYSVGKNFIYASSGNLFFYNSSVFSSSYDLGGFLSLYYSDALFLNNKIDSTSFQYYLVKLDRSSLNLDQMIFSNNTNGGNNNGTLVMVENHSHLNMNNTIYAKNSVSVFFTIKLSYAFILKNKLLYNSGKFLQTYSSDVVLVTDSTFVSIPSSSFTTLFSFEDSTAILFNVVISNSTFMGSGIESINSKVNILNTEFNSNNIYFDNQRESSFLSFKDSEISIKYSNFINNIQKSSNLIKSVRSTFKIIESNFNSNIVQDEGYLVYFFRSTVFINSTSINNSTCLTGTIGFFEFSNSIIENSVFDNNQNQGLGGALYFDIGSEANISFNQFLNSFSQIGGAIYTLGHFKSEQYENNIFENNRAIYGNNIASDGSNVTVILPKDDSNSKISYIYLSDSYDNLVSNLNYVAQVIILKVYQNDTTKYIPLDPVIIKNGIGTFSYSFNAPSFVKHFLIWVTIVETSITNVNLFKNKTQCGQFQYYNGDTGQCLFCPVNQVYIDNSCVQCPDKMKCLDAQVFTINNYYLITQKLQHPQYQQPDNGNNISSNSDNNSDSNSNSNSNRSLNINSIFKIYECPINMCFENNQCYSKQANGNLCSRCKTDVSNNLEASVSKNGLHCCVGGFKPTLISVYLIYILLLSLVLSFYKYNITGSNSLLGSIILMLQMNSIIYFSYPGLYILPLFRMSIDFIFDYCTFKLNYLEKFNIQIVSILVVYLIGISNLSTNLIIMFYNSPRLRLISRLLISDKTIERILKERKLSSKMNIKKYWNIFLMIFQPLLFNLVSIVIPKEIEFNNYLIIDITIQFYSTYHIISLVISVIVIFIIVIIIPAVIIINIYFYKSSSSSTPTKSVINNSINNSLKIIRSKLIYNSFNHYHHYRKEYRWWDFIFLVKSLLFIILSITLIYNPSHYLMSVIFIQLLYSISQYALHPQLSKTKYNIENISNLLQLILLIIIDSNLINILKFSVIDFTNKTLNTTQ